MPIPDSQTGEVLIEPENLQSLLSEAFAAGCLAVHENYQEDRDPDFTEAAWDYVASLDFTETTRPARALVEKNEALEREREQTHFAFAILSAINGVGRRCVGGVIFGGSDPQDCDWPFCACDTATQHVMEALEDYGYEPNALTQRAQSAEAQLSTLTAERDEARAGQVEYGQHIMDLEHEVTALTGKLKVAEGAIRFEIELRPVTGESAFNLGWNSCRYGIAERLKPVLAALSPSPTEGAEA